MNSVLRFVQVIALGTWVGSIIYLSIVVAQGAFGVLQSRDQAGLMVGYSLARLHYMGMVAAVLYLVAGLALAHSLKAFLQPAMLGVILMFALTVDIADARDAAAGGIAHGDGFGGRDAEG